jgi:hypothetical protein
VQQEVAAPPLAVPAPFCHHLLTIWLFAMMVTSERKTNAIVCLLCHMTPKHNFIHKKKMKYE